MAARRPLVRVGGQNVQLPAGDTLLGAGDFMKDGSVKMTGAINEAVPVTMTIGSFSAQTVPINNAAANTIFIDGTDQLTFLGSGAQGNTREVEFTTSIVLANTSRIILPGGADITTQPGDTAKFRNVDDTNIWKCVWYQRKNGRAVVEAAGGTGDFKKDGSVQMTGAFNQAPQVSIPASTVVDLGGAGSDSLYISGGGTTINSFTGGLDGMRRQVQFGAGVILAAGLVPGGARTTLSGDNAEFQAASATAWRCLSYTKADGTALVSSGGTGDFKKDGSVAMTGAFNEAPRQPVTVLTGIVQASIVAANTLTYPGNPYIDGIDVLPDGVHRTIEFTSTPILRPSTNFILPTSGNIQVAAGDVAEFVSHGGGVWAMIGYLRKDGTALVSGSSGPANTDALPEGLTNLYYTDARAKAANTDKVTVASVGAANGVAPLGSDSKIAAAYLPSYVDDVLEYANLAAFPATGETGKIYIAIDTNREYRWSGSVYTAIVASPGTTDNVPEGTTNLYFTAARVLNTALAGLSLVTGTAVVSTDSVLAGVGKLQKQINDLTTAVGGKEPTIAAGTAGQYWNGLKVFTDFAASVRGAVLTGLALGTTTPVAAADNVLTAIGKLQAQITALGGVFRIENIAATSVGQTSFAVPNGYTPGAIFVFFKGPVLAPADFTATDGANVVLTVGADAVGDILTVGIMGAVRAQDDALLSYTVATLPSAAANARKLRWCTDAGGGPQVVVSNGTNWIRVQDNTVVTV
jgi:hypothetical protein